jgi:hypothetical protein
LTAPYFARDISFRRLTLLAWSFPAIFEQLNAVNIPTTHVESQMLPRKYGLLTKVSLSEDGNVIVRFSQCSVLKLAYYGL